MGMLGEAFGARRALSPRSQESRRIATEAAEGKRSASLFSTTRRRREEQDGLTTSRRGRIRARRREIARQSLQDDMQALTQALENSDGYYFGTLHDQYFQQMMDRAALELGDSVEDSAIEELATRYYNDRYNPGRNRSSSSSSSSSSSMPRHDGPAQLDIPPEILARTDHPDWFKCPISLELMTDPVILSSGQTYQREAITQHLIKNNKDPMSNKILKNKNMVPNMSLRHAITAHLANITSDSTSSSMGTQTSPKGSDKKPSSKKQTTRKNKKEDDRKKRAAAAEKRNNKKSGGRKPKHTRRKRKASCRKKKKTSKKK